MLAAGITDFEAALDLSPARLKLMANAARRKSARDTLAHARATLAVMAAFWAKNGGSAYRTLDRRLEKQATEDSYGS